MDIIVNPPKARWNELCQRNPIGSESVEKIVREILVAVKTEGDKVLFKYAKEFDKIELDSLRLTDEEIDAGVRATSAELARAIDRAAENITKFHSAQLPHEVDVTVTPGVRCLQKAVPIQRVGLYIPGGKAPLFSTVLMLAIPAALAGCKEVVLFTPEGVNGIAPPILYAANKCGIREVYRIGGAQAIAAMAYGTATIRRVNKIFGPGNQFVTKAKQLVADCVAIDMPAGPSEVMVVADCSARPTYCASDLLSQAEHGPDSQAILVCDTVDMAEKVFVAVEEQKQLLSRAESVSGSLSKSRIIVFDNRDVMLEFANCYAPEHLILSVENSWEAASHINAAGSVFIGNYSPESAGDYASGTNHTLPTSGWAASMSGVNIDSFMHKITYQELTQDGLKTLSDTIIAMADAEGLDAHAAAVKLRINDLK